MLLSPYHPLQLAWGLLIWSVYFIVMYGGLSVACSTAPPQADEGPFTWVNFALLLLTLLTSALLLYQAHRCRRISRQSPSAPASEVDLRDAGSDQLENFREFIATMAIGVNFFAGVVTLLVGAPVAMLAPCV